MAFEPAAGLAPSRLRGTLRRVRRVSVAFGPVGSILSQGPASRARVVGVVAALTLLVGCGEGGSEATPTTADLSPAVESWLGSLPEEPAIWQRCPPAGGRDGVQEWEDSFLGGWESLAAAPGPPGPASGAWRAYLEAGNVWAAAVIADVDEVAMLEDLRAAEALLVEELERWVERSEVEARLAPSEDSLPVCD